MSTVALVESYTIGGRTFVGSTDVGNIKVLNGNNLGAGVRCTPREMGQTSGYVVPGAKTFTVYHVRFKSNVNSVEFEFGYADTDIGLNAVAAFVNPVSTMGTVGSNLGVLDKALSSTEQRTDGLVLALDVLMVIPTGKYLYYEANNNNNQCIIYGIEE